jgi:peptide/nickel transport system substrate-binding protein
MHGQAQTTELSRRTFLTTTSTALIGAALGGLASHGIAAQRHPQRGGVLPFGMRNDPGGLDPHRHNQQHTNSITAAMYNGLTDVDDQGNIVPSLAESWEPNKELTAWVFRLRKGVECSRCCLKPLIKINLYYQ